MKITIFSESPNDEAALRILVEAILQEEIEEVPRRNQLRSRDVHTLLENTPVVIRSAYYQTESEAIVIVCDSDDKPVHNSNHEKEDNTESRNCRFCILRRKVSETLADLKPQLDRQMIKTAIGVAVPSIEAWFLCDDTKWILAKMLGDASWKAEKFAMTDRV